MAQAPVMPVFTDALIGDTTHLSTEQFGAYVLVLLATWRNNGRALPDDDEQLARVCRLGVRRWRSHARPILQKFFDINSTGWHQRRLEKEWDRVAGILTKRRTSASAGGRASAASKRQPTHEPDSSPPISPPRGDRSNRKKEQVNGAAATFRPLRDPTEIARERGLKR